MVVISLNQWLAFDTGFETLRYAEDSMFMFCTFVAFGPE